MAQPDLKANLHDFQLKHLIRAHSQGGNSSDRSTPVNDAAFELSPDAEISGTLSEALTYTNICATCGLNIINFIDTGTGKIVKRFNDDAFVNKQKEVYYRLAWTVINGSSVLVAGGEHGQIKVILPKYSSCLARIDAHQHPIRSLLFDYKYKNILLSGSDDHTIKIWKLDLNEGGSHLETEFRSELLGLINYNQENSKPEKVLSMCFVPDRFLLVSTDLGVYNVQVNMRKMLKSKRGDETKLEKIDDNIANDKALDYMMSCEIGPKENILVAQPANIQARSNKKQAVDMNVVTNSLIFLNNFLYANEIDSKYIHIIDVETGPDSFKLNLIDSLFVSDELFSKDIRTSCFIEKESALIFKSSSEGRLNCAKLDSSGRKVSLVLNYDLPSDYTIKSVGVAGRTEVKNYNLFDKPKILFSVCNMDSVVSITDQNIIGIFRRFRENEKCMVTLN